MAVNVDTVYKTVLLILNQQQRGYMTPDEFNKVGTQVQLTMFEGYASDLNQQYRLPDNDTEYADRVKNIQQKLQFFQRTGATVYVGPHFTLTPTDIYRLGSVFYRDVEITQYVQRNELRQILLSPLTQPTDKFPLYLYEDDKLTVFPTTIQSDITISYLKTPNPINWTFTTGAQGQYVYNPADPAAQNFELDITEQNEIILRILAYAGIIIQDPTIIQSAASAVATEDTNEKQ